MDRSYLFAPGHNAKLLGKVFDAGADAVMLDLEDAVPPEAKATARAMVAEVLTDHPAWVRVNAAQTAWCEADLAAVAGARVRDPDPQGGIRRRRSVGHRPRPGQTRSSAPSKAPAVCSPRRRSPRCPAFASWRWAGWTCSAT